MWSEEWKRFEIDLAGINDDLASVQRGESFVTQPVNQLEDKVEWMAGWMMRAKKSKRLCVKGQWCKTKVREYSDRIRDFLELLLLFILMTSGQPARGEEITPIDDAMEEEGTDVVGQAETVFNLQSAHQGAAAMTYGVRGDIIHSLTKESLLVFGELSD